MTMPILTLDSVEKSFDDVRAVRGVSLAVEAGEIVALLGPNGAGKTTLLRMIIAMLRPDRGSVRYAIDGVPVERMDPRVVGYLPEERGLYLDVPVIRTLTYFGVLRGMTRPDAKREAVCWLERFGLADRANDEMRSLSKGNQQKVQFIGSVLHRPLLAILDEPFSGLDPLNQELFLELIRELRTGGATVLLSAHQMQLVERVADRVVLIRSGLAVEQGTLDELRGRWGAGRRVTVRLAPASAAAAAAELRTLAGIGSIEERTAGEIVVTHARMSSWSTAAASSAPRTSISVSATRWASSTDGAVSIRPTTTPSSSITHARSAVRRSTTGATRSARRTIVSSDGAGRAASTG